MGIKWVKIKDTVPDEGVWSEVLELRDADADTWSGSSAATASFDLELSDGTTAVDLSDHVSGTSTSTIAIEIPVAEWAEFAAAPQTLSGWLYWTPSGGSQEALAYIELSLVAG